MHLEFIHLSFISRAFGVSGMRNESNFIFSQIAIQLFQYYLPIIQDLLFLTY